MEAPLPSDTPGAHPKTSSLDNDCMDERIFRNEIKHDKPPMGESAHFKQGQSIAVGSCAILMGSWKNGFRKAWKNLQEPMLSEVSRTRRTLYTATAGLRDDQP